MHLGDALGSPKPITINGDTFMCRPLTLGDIGTIQRHLGDQKPNILKDALEACRDQPPAVAQITIREAVKMQAEMRDVGPDEALRWVQENTEGQAYALFLIVKRADPKTTHTHTSMMEFISRLSGDEQALFIEQVKALFNSDVDEAHPTSPRGGRADKRKR